MNGTRGGLVRKLLYPQTHKGKTRQNNLHIGIQNKVTDSNNLCRFGVEEDETFHHLILECPCFYTYRLRIMKNKQWEGTHQWNLDEIYEILRIKSINLALKQESCDKED